MLCPTLTMLSSNNKTVSLLTLWKLGLMKRSINFGFVMLLLLLIDWYSSLFVLLKPDFDCYNSFGLSIDKVTTWTYGFVSVIANFVAPFAAETKQSAVDQVRMRLIS